MKHERFNPVTLEILWNRLVAIVDEASATLVRTSFSTLAREANDLAVALCSATGDRIVESTGSIPAFLGTVSMAVQAMMEKFPPETLEPGDVIITNDPWIAAGHLPDLVMALPIFKGSTLVAISATVCHLPDVGGGGSFSVRHRQVFEEGLLIPPMKIERAGKPDETLMELLLANVRVPELVRGDIRAYRTANEASRRRLLDMMDEYHLEDLDDLSSAIQAYSERAMRSAIGAIPDGTYSHEMVADGILGQPIVTKVAVRVSGSDIDIDLTGSSEQVAGAVNVVANYTYAMAAYAIKCAIAPGIPNNSGSSRPITVSAPRGSIYNAQPPVAVGARHQAGHLVTAAVLSALSTAIPDRVQAASFAPQWAAHFHGETRNDSDWIGTMFFSGGQGGSANLDGNNCLSFPGNVSAGSTEIFEGLVPIRILRREFRTDSGGPGRHRGGLGQDVELLMLGDGLILASAWSSRRTHPPEGLLGGRPGAAGRVLLNGVDVNLNEEQVINSGDVVLFQLPGGGGFKDPALRARTDIAADLEDGLITPEHAAAEYGYSVEFVPPS